MVVGREAVREFYTGWFAVPYTAIQVHAQTVTVASSDDLVYLVGEGSLVLSEPQEERQVPGKYLGVWKKIVREWRLAALSWTGNSHILRGSERHFKPIPRKAHKAFRGCAKLRRLFASA